MAAIYPDDIFKCIFWNENIWISIKISLRFVAKGGIDQIPVLVQIMAWHQATTIIWTTIIWLLIYRYLYSAPADLMLQNTSYTMCIFTRKSESYEELWNVRRIFWRTFCANSLKTLDAESYDANFVGTGGDNPDNKVHGANMGPTWVLSAPGGSHVGPMNLVIREPPALPVTKKLISRRLFKESLVFRKITKYQAMEVHPYTKHFKLPQTKKGMCNYYAFDD